MELLLNWIKMLNASVEQPRTEGSLNRDPHNTVKAFSFSLPSVEYPPIWEPSVGSRRIHDRNKYGVKRARALFTKGYNCQKNKRSQCLFAHIFLRHLPIPSEAELSVPCLRIPRSPLPELPSRANYIRSILVCFYLLFGYLQCMLHLHTTTVSSSSSPPFLAVHFSPFSFPRRSLSIPNHRRDSVEKLTRVVGQRIRNYDLSRRRDYLLSRRLWNLGSRSVFVAYVQPHLQPHLPLVSHCNVVSRDFLSKFITKADKARRSNVDIF